MTRLNNKTAVITGGTTGIGFATAKEFISEGARVIITGRNESRLTEAANKLGYDCCGFGCRWRLYECVELKNSITRNLNFKREEIS